MTTDDRLERLELELKAAKRRGRILLAGVLALAAAAWGVAPSLAAGDKVVKAMKFVLVDGTGAERGTWGVDEDGPGLIMSDEKGTTRAAWDVSEDGPKLLMADEKGKELWTAP